MIIWNNIFLPLAIENSAQGRGIFLINEPVNVLQND
jgi:hypothetical protein